MRKNTIYLSLFLFLVTPSTGGWAQATDAETRYAEGLFDEVVELLQSPDSPEDWLLKADALHKTGAFQEALEAYNLAEEAGASSGALFLHRGICRVTLNQWTEAAADLGRAHELLPDEKRVPYYFAAIAYGERNERQTLAYLEDALKHDAEYFDALYLKGAALYELGRNKEAQEVFARCRSLRPDDERSQLNHAMASIELSRFGQALEVLDELINSQDDEVAAESYYQRGAARYKLRRTKEACEDWANAAALGDREAQILTDTVCMTGKKKRSLKRKQVYVAF